MPLLSFLVQELFPGVSLKTEDKVDEISGNTKSGFLRNFFSQLEISWQSIARNFVLWLPCNKRLWMTHIWSKHEEKNYSKGAEEIILLITLKAM